MRLDHIAYRCYQRYQAANFFERLLGYKIADEFQLEFADGSRCDCIAMEPPEKTMKTTPLEFGEIWFNWSDPQFGGAVNYHLAPEIFVSDGHNNSIVGKWVFDNGPGIHHLAYCVTDIYAEVEKWKSYGIRFLSSDPLKCPGLTQIFTEVNPVTGIIYELIERTDKGFCKENVKNLMESSR